ncbi:hypothetical protein [Desulfosporosinus sp. SB140]|uniref:hypothetical protein n=1 Tax=Desulfosporosinus paludis TaxID=3115649 RepID=UPI00388E10D4
MNNFSSFAGKPFIEKSGVMVGGNERIMWKLLGLNYLVTICHSQAMAATRIVWEIKV